MSILPRCNQADVDELQYLACLYGFRRNQAGRARLDIAAEHASSSNATGRRLSAPSHAKCGHFGPNVTASAHQAIEKQSADVAAHATTDAIHPCRQRRLRQNPRVCQHQPRAGSASAREASSRSPPVRQEKSRTTSIQSLGLPDRCLQVVGVDARHADGMIGTVLNGIGERRCRKSASHRQQAINRLDRACRAPQADRHALPAPIPREPGRAFFPSATWRPSPIGSLARRLGRWRSCRRGCLQSGSGGCNSGACRENQSNRLYFHVVLLINSAAANLSGRSAVADLAKPVRAP